METSFTLENVEDVDFFLELKIPELKRYIKYLLTLSGDSRKLVIALCSRLLSELPGFIDEQLKEYLHLISAGSIPIVVMEMSIIDRLKVQACNPRVERLHRMMIVDLLAGLGDLVDKTWIENALGPLRAWFKRFNEYKPVNLQL